MVVAEQVSKSQVVAPLAPVTFDDVQMGDSMPGPGFKDKYVSAVSAGVTPVDPSVGFQRCCDRSDRLGHAEADGQVDDRLGQQRKNG